MNKVGIYYAYWVKDWDADFHIYIDKAANLGFDILEVNAGIVTNMSPEERKSLKSHADEKNLALTYCIGLSQDYDVASDNDSIRNRGIQFLKDQVKAIGEIGGGKISGIVYGAWPGSLPDGASDKRPFWDHSVASMREVTKAAEDHSVIFNIEVVNRFEQFLINTSEEAVDYVRQVNSPNVKVLLDTFHANIEEDSISQAVETAGQFLGHVHIGENNRKPPGYGHFPWGELFSALEKIDYTEDIVMEPFLLPGGQIGRDTKVWRDLSIGMDLDQEAQKALLFIRKKIDEAVLQ